MDLEFGPDINWTWIYDSGSRSASSGPGPGPLVSVPGGPGSDFGQSTITVRGMYESI